MVIGQSPRSTAPGRLQKMTNGRHSIKVLLNCAVHSPAIAADLDARCVHMAYLNLSLYCIPAVIVQGNTINLKEYDRWYTPAYLWGKWIWRASMPFGESGYVSDEMLKRFDEPVYGAYRYMEQQFAATPVGGTTDETKTT